MLQKIAWSSCPVIWDMRYTWPINMVQKWRSRKATESLFRSEQNIFLLNCLLILFFSRGFKKNPWRRRKEEKKNLAYVAAGENIPWSFVLFQRLFLTGDESARRKIERLLLRSANLPDRLLARTHAEGNVVFVKEWDNVLMSTAALELQVYIGAQLSDVRTTSKFWKITLLLLACVIGDIGQNYKKNQLRSEAQNWI